jgi:putative sigma-54 modulation protein
MIRYEFTGRHITVTPALKKHAKEHLNKLDKILDSAPMQAHVILEVEKHRQIAEIVLQWRDHSFTSNASNKDMYVAITQASEKIEKQLFKLKDRFTKRKRHALPTSEAVMVGQPATPTESGDGSGRPEAARIIRTRRYTVKPMTQEEAADQIHASDDQFVVFRNAESGRIGVIYKRKDGNFGLIEP